MRRHAQFQLKANNANKLMFSRYYDCPDSNTNTSIIGSAEGLMMAAHENWNAQQNVWTNFIANQLFLRHVTRVKPPKMSTSEWLCTESQRIGFIFWGP